jgi:hypothetical protein
MWTLYISTGEKVSRNNTTKIDKNIKQQQKNWACQETFI